MITFVSGDILHAKEQYIAQGVAEGNQEGLGTGLAFKISKRWPSAQSAFKRHCRSGMFTGGSLWAYPPTIETPGISLLGYTAGHVSRDIAIPEEGVAFANDLGRKK